MSKRGMHRLRQKVKMKETIPKTYPSKLIEKKKRGKKKVLKKKKSVEKKRKSVEKKPTNVIATTFAELLQSRAV